MSENEVQDLFDSTLSSTTVTIMYQSYCDCGFNVVMIINAIYKFRRYDTSEPKRALAELGDFFFELPIAKDMKSKMFDKIIKQVGYWNKDILMQQIKKGTFLQ